ncbi:MAG: chorismate synthase [Bacteroidetes bacterium]|nr:chorismate synthase [Bacteroidota bacterium]MBS1630534.1 chorismate synthase [Bacteroidota bacterium]
MNRFGRLFQVQIWGASHGPGLGLSLDGCPPGIPLSEADFYEDLLRRQGGNLRGTTPRKEPDKPIFQSGLFQGKTTGAPLCILFENTNTRPSDYEKLRSIPRPGHADFVAHYKYGGFEDYRGGGHFSGRLTLCLVAAGVVAKKLLPGITIQAQVTELAGCSNLEEGLQRAIDAKDSAGGIVECRIQGLPIGWGEPFWDSAESLLAHAAFAIPAVRGIEFGTGFSAARMFGSQHNDAILNAEGHTKSNHAGGIVGGLTNGNEVVFRIAIKPASSTPQPQTSWNRETNQMEEFSVKGRHDLAIALRVPPVLEAITAIVLTDLMMISNAGSSLFSSKEK